MRPPGDIRMAVLGALSERRATLRDIVQTTGLDYEAARSTIKYAVRTGVVVKAEQRREAHSRRPVTVYGCAAATDARAGGVAELSAAVRSFWERPLDEPHNTDDAYVSVDLTTTD